MKFSYFHLMAWTEREQARAQAPATKAAFVPERGKELYDNYIATMAFAEQCGFDWVGCNEHHFSPYGLMANCNLIGAALSQRTSTIKLAMLGNLIPLLNPVRVAEEYAMLDVMSGGRLVAGMIRGVPHEYIAYNVVPDESRERLREAAALIVKCWTEPGRFGWGGRRGGRVGGDVLDRAGRFRRGGPVLPVSAHLDLAEADAEAASADPDVG